MLSLDFRYAVRVLRRSPGFAATAILTLGLGIGANTALFSVFDALLMKSLPVAEPDRLVVLSMRNARGEENLELSYPVLLELRSRNQSLADLAAGTSASNRVQVRVPPSNDVETVSLAFVSGNFFETLGVEPARGRLFTAATESARTAELTAILDHGYWQRRFAGSETVRGHTTAAVVRYRLRPEHECRLAARDRQIATGCDAPGSSRRSAGGLQADRAGLEADAESQWARRWRDAAGE
jgi:putative ABC transport system permease protein